MKTTILSIMLLVQMAVFGQEAKVIKVRRNNDCFGIELTNLNVMYLNIENPLRVVYSGNGKLKVKLNNGTISQVGNDQFVAKINEGVQTLLTAYEVVGKTEKMLGSKVYRLKAVPQPTANVGGVASGKIITKSLLIASKGLGVAINEFLYDVKYEVISFTVTSNFTGEFKSEACYGPYFSAGAMSYISKLKNNSRVIFEDIKVRIVGSTKIMSIAPITLNVIG